MKKIVMAAAVAAMAASMVSAEMKITLNNRTKLDAFSTVTTDDGTDKKTVTEWMDWSGYDGAGAQNATKASDTLKFAANDENCGVTFSINIAESEKTSKDGALLTLNEYNAWASWKVGPGSLKFSAGNWKDGFADGSYRVKKDVDAQNAEGMDFEKFKLGSIFSDNKASFVDNLNAGNTAVSAYAEYSFAANDDVKINALIGSAYAAFDKVVDDDTTTYYDAQPLARVQVNVKDLFNSEIIYKKAAPRYNTFALFVKPVTVKGLDTTVGFTMDTYAGKGGEKDNGGYTDMSFDLRARYQVSKELSITSFNNISMTDLDSGRTLAGIVGHKGAEGYLADGKGTVMFKTAMWNNLSARYVVNETLAATLNVGIINGLSKVDGDNTDYGMEWRVTPAVQVYAAPNASIWAGVAISGTSVEDASVTAIQVPVIFRVKM